MLAWRCPPRHRWCISSRRVGCRANNVGWRGWCIFKVAQVLQKVHCSKKKTCITFCAARTLLGEVCRPMSCHRHPLDANDDFRRPCTHVLLRRNALSPFRARTARDDSEHITKLPKMPNGRMFIHAFGLLRGECWKSLDIYSPVYGKPLQKVLAMALLSSYVDRQDPVMVAAVFSDPAVKALYSR